MEQIIKAKNVKKQFNKWTPSTSVWPKNSLVSSDAAAEHKLAFIPSYEQDSINMFFLLSNEYMRMWFKERHVYDKINYSDLVKKKEEMKNQRKYVPKYKPKKKGVKELPHIYNRYQTVSSKIKHQ